MFTTKVKIQFHDCDPAGILFYANIYKFSHNVYQELLEGLSSKNYFHDDEIALPITKSSAEYFLPMKSGDDYLVKLYISQLRESSFEITYLFYDTESKVHAEVKTVHVSVNKKSFKKVNLPADLNEFLKANYV